MIRDQNSFWLGLLAGGGPIFIAFLIAGVGLSDSLLSSVVGPIGFIALLIGFAYTPVALVVSIVLFTKKQSSLASGILAGIPVGWLVGFTTCVTIRA